MREENFRKFIRGKFVSFRLKNKETLNMLGTEGIIKATYKPIANIIFNDEC